MATPIRASKMSRAEVARIQDLRRSSASSRHKDKTKYSRKEKHRGKRDFS